MKTKAQNVLPKMMPGTIHKQFIRCGKSNCKCTRGEKHIAYYFFTRINGKLTKTYIRKSEIRDFSEMVDQAKAERMERRQAIKKSSELLRQLRSDLRERLSVY